MPEKLPYLNLGCGYHFNDAWTNIDFVSTGSDVIAHNLLHGIPAPDSHYEVVYHSHVLEHFSKQNAVIFLKECFRVLKPGGTLRVAVPDLRMIINEYLAISLLLDKSPEDEYLQSCHQWLLLEMYDQTVRSKPGGEMAAFIKQERLLNPDFIIKRCGYEVKSILEAKVNPSIDFHTERKAKILNLASLKQKLKTLLLKRLLKKDYDLLPEAKFRSSGEIHQWMYDKHSLRRILLETGFTNIETQTAFKSSIPDWESFQLESNNNEIRKPDSLFMEAQKPAK